MTHVQQPWDDAWARLDQRKGFDRLSGEMQFQVYSELIKMWYDGYNYAAQEAMDQRIPPPLELTERELQQQESKEQ